MDEIGIGLVGYGAIGRLHALCYRMLPLAYPELPPVRIAAVATASEASAERARRELGDLFTTTRLEKLLARNDVQVVDCCAPTDKHGPVALAALAANKALFCEKPLAATDSEAQAIAAAAQASGLPVGLNYHFRHCPAIEEARRLAANGLLGEVRGFHLHYSRASNLRAERPISWRFVGPGSGVLADLGSHMIDLVLHLLGPVARVSARTRVVIPERPGADGRLVPVEGDDAAWLTLELANGGLGTIAVSKLVPGAGDDVRFEAHGAHGALLFDSTDPNGLQVVEGAAGVARRVATLSRTQPPASLPSPEGSTGVLQWHLASTASFLRSYANGSSPQPGAADGIAVDRVIAAARRSAAEGGGWVDLSVER
jgi:predicted dehydrogenase